MKRVFLLGTVSFALIVLFCETGLAQDKNIGQFYDRLAQDIKDGKPMVATVFVALCDNDSQGIVPVKNPKICDGESPEAKMYWATSGGLKGYLKKGWRRVSYEKNVTDEISRKAIWHRRFIPGGELRKRGVKSAFDVFLVGLAYRGKNIRKANIDYFRAIHRRQMSNEKVSIKKKEVEFQAGSSSHIVGYVGHDYFFDCDGEKLMTEALGPGGTSKLNEHALQKGVFALSCAGEELIKPHIKLPSTHILILNRHLAYPGAWTVGGIVQGVAWGKSLKGIHQAAARAFSKGMGRTYGTAFKSFSHGD